MIQSVISQSVMIQSVMIWSVQLITKLQNSLETEVEEEVGEFESSKLCHVVILPGHGQS